VNPKQINTTVPPTAAIGPITVTLDSAQFVSSGVFKPKPKITGFTPGSGPVATSVVLTGTNFANVTSVLVGTVAASFSLDSATQITLTIPSGATTGLIKVVSPGGNATTASNFVVG
jgi:hypothetical protein